MTPGDPRPRPRRDPLLHTGSVRAAPGRGDLRHTALRVSGLKLLRARLVLGTQLLHASKLFFFFFSITFMFSSPRQGPNLIINQPDELLESMSEWCKEHHGKVKPSRASAAMGMTRNPR